MTKRHDGLRDDSGMPVFTKFLLRASLAVAVLTPAAFGASAQAPRQSLVVENEIKTIESAENLDIVVKGKAELHITGRNPLTNTTVSIIGDKAMVCFEGLTCTELKESGISSVSIDGRAFNPESDRIAIYGNGSAVLPNSTNAALTIYTAENFGGESMECKPDIYYQGKKTGKPGLPQEVLGAFDNKIRSFRLRRGYACVLANNPDGTGFSKVFIADKEDLEVAKMPQGLEFASFIRISTYQWVGKRGICGKDLALVTRSSWYNDWGASSTSLESSEYVPMRHNRYWDGWDKIGSRTNTTNVLGYNEPDHSDQSNLSVETAIEEWPNFMKCGLRIGSPAPDAVTKDWLKKFIAEADRLNYRVDFVATHMYWNSQRPSNLVNTITKACVNDYGGRPMWITEWNNGANWTHEHWPDAKGPQRDADFNLVLDENGNTKEVTRPHTEANSEVQKAWLAEMLPAFDACKWLERHSFYNWVEDARMVAIDGKLTPAGKVFADFQSVPGYSSVNTYDHQWHIAPPLVTIKPYSTYFAVVIYDHNGETGVNYTVERSVDGGRWEVIAVLEAGKDYSYGKNKNLRQEPEANGNYRYRVKAMSYIGTESDYSKEVGINVDYVSGIVEEEIAKPTATVSGGNTIVLRGFRPGENVEIHSASGVLVSNAVFPSDGGECTVEGLGKGLYIVKGGIKVVL